nr:hypothetical protein GCM10020092_010480 [Actinoplanes digitatis]
MLVVGHELSVIGTARQLRREKYHGLEVVGACLPPGHDGVIDLPVFGTFDDVASAVDLADADTVVVLSCPELDGTVLRRLAWRLERDEVDLVVASALVDVARRAYHDPAVRRPADAARRAPSAARRRAHRKGPLRSLRRPRPAHRIRATAVSRRTLRPVDITRAGTLSAGAGRA